MASCDFHDAIHVAGITEVVNDHDSLCPRRDAALQIIGIQAHVFVDVAEYGRCAEHERLRDACPIRLCRADDLIPRLQADGEHGGGQRHRAVAVGDRVLSALPSSKFLLELFCDVRAGELVARDDVQCGVVVLLCQNRPFEELCGFLFSQHILTLNM